MTESQKVVRLAIAMGSFSFLAFIVLAFVSPGGAASMMSIALVGYWVGILVGESVRSESRQDEDA